MRYLVTLSLAALCCLVPISAVDGDTSSASTEEVTPEIVEPAPDDLDAPPELVEGEEVVVEPDPSEPTRPY